MTIMSAKRGRKSHWNWIHGLPKTVSPIRSRFHSQFAVSLLHMLWWCRSEWKSSQRTCTCHKSCPLPCPALITYANNMSKQKRIIKHGVRSIQFHISLRRCWFTISPIPFQFNSVTADVLYILIYVQKKESVIIYFECIFVPKIINLKMCGTTTSKFQFQ